MSMILVLFQLDGSELLYSTVSEAYNFTNSGAGSYNFEASNLFYIVQAESNKVIPLYPESETLTAKLAGNLAVVRKDVNAGLSKRASFVGCTVARQTLLNAAASEAQRSPMPPALLRELIFLSQNKGRLSELDCFRYTNSHTIASTRFTTWCLHRCSSQHYPVPLLSDQRQHILFVYI